jgi:hypothetical protein
MIEQSQIFPQGKERLSVSLSLFFAALGYALRASCLLGRHSYCLSCFISPEQCQNLKHKSAYE